MRIAVALSSLIPFIALVSGAAVPSAVLDEAFPFPGQASALLALPDTENGLAEGTLVCPMISTPTNLSFARLQG